MSESDVVDRKPIDSYLNRFGISASNNARKRYCSFRDEFCDFDDVEFTRLTDARNKFVAHSDKVAKWEDIGVLFSDVEKYLYVSEARIDTFFHVFFDLSDPKQSLFNLCKEEPNMNARSFEQLVEVSLVSAQNK
ncbi:MAG: hypothetical protein M9939_18150 [Mesorhizobium sp.]|nr:hypothetical protein [Mesorhizobium sp.]MCO5163061.1 hypothetical protein [Mesorhizobium sp.]